MGGRAQCGGVSIVSCTRPYFSGVGSGNIAYIELFQRNSIIAKLQYIKRH